MREILFRGKDRYGEWHYSMSIARHCTCDGVITDYYIGAGHASVKAETVGQYTGLTDKNGTKIFEGDIIKSPNNVNFEVKWQPISASWQMSNETLHCLFYMRILDMFEVIGNIHDNPELLEEEK